MKILKYTGWLAALIALGFFANSVVASSLPVGVTQFYLAGAGTNNNSTNIQLTSFKTPDGRPITMAMFGTVGYGAIDPQTSVKIEDVSFTGVTQNINGTATLTGVSRGLDFVYPYMASTTLAYAHSGGATFIITNTAGFYYNEFAMPNNSNDFTWPTASSSIASKGYVDFVAFNGAAVIPATTGVSGVVQLGTGAQAAASNGVGSSSASTVLTTKIATSTYNSSTAPNVVLVTGATGAIDPGFIPNLATSTTIGGYVPLYQAALQQQIITTTGTSTFSVPSGITKVAVTVQGAGAPGGSCYENGGNGQAAGGGGAGGWTFKVIDVTGTSTIQVFVAATSTATTTQAAWTTFGTNGFYLIANGGNPGASLTSGQGSALGGAGGKALKGDININGQSGANGVFFNSTGAAVYNSGTGGNSIMGFGGQGVSIAGAGADATGYGAGSGAPACTGAALGLAGSATQGFIRVQW